MCMCMYMHGHCTYIDVQERACGRTGEQHCVSTREDWPWSNGHGFAGGRTGWDGWDGLQGQRGRAEILKVASERDWERLTVAVFLSSLDRSIDSPQHRPVDATCIKSSSDRKQQTGRRDITGRQRRETRAATSSGLEVGGNEEAWMTEYHQAGNGPDLQYKRWVASGWCWCRRWADVLSAFWTPFLHVE